MASRIFSRRPNPTPVEPEAPVPGSFSNIQKATDYISELSRSPRNTESRQSVRSEQSSASMNPSHTRSGAAGGHPTRGAPAPPVEFHDPYVGTGTYGSSSTQGLYASAASPIISQPPTVPPVPPAYQNLARQNTTASQAPTTPKPNLPSRPAATTRESENPGLQRRPVPAFAASKGNANDETDTDASDIEYETSYNTGNTTPDPSFSPVGVPKALDNLQSDEHRALLEELSNLRSLGIEDYVELPQIVVAGDTSSGKSSVLEAITGIPFPRSEGICTRFATQIMMRHKETESGEVTMLLDRSSHTAEEYARLKGYHRQVHDLSQIPDLVAEATGLMGVKDSSSNDRWGSFSKDILNIKIEGPTKQDLMLVDLPGLTHSAGERNNATVLSIVEHHIKKPRSIVLAVVRADNELVNQAILQKAKKFDPHGDRTLGIITRPDVAEKGSGTERSFVELACNQNPSYELRHGWHVLRNRSHSDMKEGTSNSERDRLETRFFDSPSAWSTVPLEDKGINALRDKLQRLLYEHVRREIPKVRQEIQAHLNSKQDLLDKLGRGRGSPQEMRRLLNSLCYRAGILAMDAAKGHYEDPFFHETGGEKGWQMLRAKVQQLNEDFNKQVREVGNKWYLQSGDTLGFGATSNSQSPSRRRTSSSHEQEISKERAIDTVTRFMDAYRGTELPGHYNPVTINYFLFDVSRFWDAEAQRHIASVVDLCEEFIRRLIMTTMPADIGSRLWDSQLQEQWETRRQKARKEADWIFEDRLQPASTFSLRFVEKVALANSPIVEEAEIVEDSPDTPGEGEKVRRVRRLVKKSKPGEFTASKKRENAEQFLSSATAYYEISWEIFVSDINRQVIERHLLKDLDQLFSGEGGIMMLDDRAITEIAKESDGNTKKREGLMRDIAMLKKAKSAFYAL